MTENEQLAKVLKPVIAMREDWFSYADELPVIFGPQISAQRIDYLLGATVAAYEYAIQNLEGDSDLDLTEWHWRYKGTNSELISFYNPSMHFWKMNELIEKLCFECKRTGQEIRPTLHYELMLKQLEMCRMMVNYSIQGDIWSRAFSAALSLIELINHDFVGIEFSDEDLSLKLTSMAQLACLSNWGEREEEFTFPYFGDIDFDQISLLTLFGVGIDIFLRAERCLPYEYNEDLVLIALYDFDTNVVKTIRYETNFGTLYRERGFWWNFGESAEEFFNDYEMIYVRPEFVEVFDSSEREGVEFNVDQITPYALTYEELHPNE